VISGDILIISNCYIPTGISFLELLRILENFKFSKLVILGDFIDFPRRPTRQFIDSLEKDSHKFFNRILRLGCREIVYVVGDRDGVLLEWSEAYSRLFSTRRHMVKLCAYHVESIHGRKLVFSHGHVQINIAIPESLNPEYSDEQVLIEAARRARRKEEIAGLRSILPRDAWWFIGHTNLLYIDEKYRIVHVGYLAEKAKIGGCGPISEIIKPSEESRGVVMIDNDYIHIIKLENFEISKKVKLI